jgi:Protein of unknown function (DUF3105)
VAGVCELRVPGARGSGIRPPVAGPPAPAAVADGVHAAAPGPTGLVGALRRGRVVVQYRPSLAAPLVRRLRGAIARSRPDRLVIAPDGSGMPYLVAATAWGRLLGCRSLPPAALTALESFARHNAGRGPEARP